MISIADKYHQDFELPIAALLYEAKKYNGNKIKHILKIFFLQFIYTYLSNILKIKI